MNTEEEMAWANETPFLAGLPRVNPFSVPEGYFVDAKSHSIRMTRISEMQGNAENFGYSVPDNYFTHLSSAIHSRIKGLEMAPDLGFTLPDGYFEKLNASILQRTNRPAKPKLIRLRLWQTDLMKYASAACVIFIAGTGLYFNQQHALTIKQTTELNREQMLYDIDEYVIIDHIQSENAKASENNGTAKNLETYILNNYSTNEISQEM